MDQEEVVAVPQEVKVDHLGAVVEVDHVEVAVDLVEAEVAQVTYFSAFNKDIWLKKIYFN